jgi:hypothetical protein
VTLPTISFFGGDYRHRPDFGDRGAIDHAALLTDRSPERQLSEVLRPSSARWFMRRYRNQDEQGSRQWRTQGRPTLRLEKGIVAGLSALNEPCMTALS